MRLNRLNQLVDRDGIPLEGNWRLTRRHRLEYRRRGGEEETVLAGELEEVRPSGLGFRFAERRLDGDAIIRQMALRGRWQADESNRLSFVVEGERGRQQRLTLQGGWSVGSNQEILYRFTRTDLKRRQREEHLLRFQGHWEISNEQRLAYVLDRGSGSLFRFRGAFQTGSLLAKKGEIRYQLGAEMDGQGARKTITLFGRWKVSRRLELSFELPSAGGRVQSVDFKAVFSVNRSNQITARLIGRKGDPAGLEVRFTREFFKPDGELFIRLRAAAEEKAMEAGARWKW